MNTFHLKIVTPASDFYTGDVEYMSADTVDGRIGFMRGALPRVCILSSGVIEIKTSVISQRVLCGEGLILVNADGITVLSKHCGYEGDDESRDDVVYDPNSGEYSAMKADLAASINKYGSEHS